MTKYRWSFGWTCNRSHAHHIMLRGCGKAVSLCGAIVYPDGPYGGWTVRQYNKKLNAPKCKHCLRMTGEKG